MSNFKPLIPVISFVLGSVLLALGQPLGLAPFVLSMCALALQEYYSRTTREQFTALEVVQAKVRELEGWLRVVSEAQAKDHQELVSIRNHTRPVGGWVK